MGADSRGSAHKQQSTIGVTLCGYTVTSVRAYRPLASCRLVHCPPPPPASSLPRTTPSALAPFSRWCRAMGLMGGKKEGGDLPRVATFTRALSSMDKDAPREGSTAGDISPSNGGSFGHSSMDGTVAAEARGMWRGQGGAASAGCPPARCSARAARAWPRRHAGRRAARARAVSARAWPAWRADTPAHSADTLRAERRAEDAPHRGAALLLLRG